MNQACLYLSYVGLINTISGQFSNVNEALPHLMKLFRNYEIFAKSF